MIKIYLLEFATKNFPIKSFAKPFRSDASVRSRFDDCSGTKGRDQLFDQLPPPLLPVERAAPATLQFLRQKLDFGGYFEVIVRLTTLAISVQGTCKPIESARRIEVDMCLNTHRSFRP